jgi:hypothetical protein
MSCMNLEQACSGQIILGGYYAPDGFDYTSTMKELR